MEPHNKQVRRYYLHFAVENCKLGLKKAKILKMVTVRTVLLLTLVFVTTVVFWLSHWLLDGLSKGLPGGQEWEKNIQNRKGTASAKTTKTMILKRRNFWWCISYIESMYSIYGASVSATQLKEQISPKWGRLYILPLVTFLLRMAIILNFLWLFWGTVLVVKLLRYGIWSSSILQDDAKL